MTIRRKVGETIDVRVTVKSAGAVLSLSGGTAKARMRGRSTRATLDAEITLTEASGLIDANFPATSTADMYDFECFLTLNDEVQCVATQTFNIVESVYP